MDTNMTMEQMLEFLKERDSTLIDTLVTTLHAENKEEAASGMSKEELVELVKSVINSSKESNEEEDEKPEPVEEEKPEPVEEEKLESKELSNMDVNEIAAVGAMADIAANQECYDTDAVRKLQMEVIAEDEDRQTFAEKLATIQIQPNPIAPGDSSQDTYSLDNALGLTGNDHQDYGLEKAVSNEIKRKTKLPVGANAVAIPREHLTQLIQLNATTATNSVGTAIEDVPVGTTFRSDVPDPSNAMQYFNRLASGPGDPYIIKMNVPAPAAVAEPANAGYAVTGDPTTAKLEMTPHLLVGSYVVSGLANADVEGILPNVLKFALQKTKETQSVHALAGGATNEVTGIYGTTGIGSATVTAQAGWTVAEIAAAIDSTYGNPKDRVKLFCHPESRSYLRSLAQPPAVGSFMMDGRIDGAEVISTKALSVGDTKKFRGLVVSTNDVYYKEWDDAIFVSQRYENGNFFLVVEVFWDLFIVHPSSHYRIHQA